MDDDKVRIWSATGDRLHCSEPLPDGYAMVGLDGDHESIATRQAAIGLRDTTITVIPERGARAEGDVEQAAVGAKLRRTFGNPPSAVFHLPGTRHSPCRIRVVRVDDLRGPELSWSPGPCCAPSELRWMADDGDDRLLLGVTWGYDEGSSLGHELLVVSARQADLVGRIPGKWSHGAFDGLGGFHAVRPDSGGIVAFDESCRELRTDDLHRAAIAHLTRWGRDAMMSIAYDGVARVWAAQTGEVLRELVHPDTRRLVRRRWPTTPGFADHVVGALRRETAPHPRSPGARLLQVGFARRVRALHRGAS